MNLLRNQPPSGTPALATPPGQPPVLADELRRLRSRMSELFRRYEDFRSGDPTLAEALAELHSAFEELTVAQQELREQNGRLREAWSAMHVERARYLSLFHSMSDAYFVTPPNALIQEANEPAARIFNRPVGYLIGKPLALYVPCAERNVFRRNLAHCLATNEGLTWETALRSAPQTEIPVEMRVMVSSAELIGPQRVYWLVRDIRDRREARQRLVQAERLGAIGEMVAGLAHESRNALQRSQACLSMLALEVRDRPAAGDLIDRLRSAQQRLVHLYEQVRAYAAPVKVEVQRVDLIQLLQEVFDDLLFVHPGRIIKLNLSGDPNDPPVTDVDPVAMSQVFANIIENSIAACGDPVRIDFDWAKIDVDGKQELRLQLRDNGPGLSGDVAARLFEPFFTTKTHGTGLGMSIVRRLVDSHGGTVEIGRTGEIGRTDSQGTELIITLPRQTPPRQTT